MRCHCKDPVIKCDHRGCRCQLCGELRSSIPDMGEMFPLPPELEIFNTPTGETKMREVECHGLDTPERVCFYEQDFYVLSNFSAFTLLHWSGIRFDTLEAAYHWEKFHKTAPRIAEYISAAPSAHAAFKHAEEFKHLRRPDWDHIKVGIMRDLLRAKVRQHEYVKRKLLATGDRELVENSWRDSFWGWGPNKDGLNMLGNLWMEIREEVRQQEGG